MWALDCEEGWALKNWCFWTVVLEKTLESPLDCKEIQPVHSEGAQPWDFFGRNDAEAETPVLWPPHVKSWLIGKDSDTGRDWGQEEKGTTEDEMVGWHHWLHGHESEWTPGVGDGQGGLACCDSRRSQRVRHDWATELKWTETFIYVYSLLGVAYFKVKRVDYVLERIWILDSKRFCLNLAAGAVYFEHDIQSLSFYFLLGIIYISEDICEYESQICVGIQKYCFIIYLIIITDPF